MARHTSSREASGTWASTSPVAGLLTAIARSFVAPTHAPPTYIFTRSPMGLVVMRYSQRPAPYSSGEYGARISASLNVEPSTALANRKLSGGAPRRRVKVWWRRRESNPNSCEATAPYRGGIAQKSAILRGRRVAGVLYLACRAAIPLAAWITGPRRSRR